MMGSEFPSEPPASSNPSASGQPLSGGNNAHTINLLRSSNGPPPAQPGNDGSRYYTIQRVNGNGANGKGDGTAGAHKHTMEESDRVKKSSIQRQFLKEEKERRKSLVSNLPCIAFASDFSNSETLYPLHAQHKSDRPCGHIVIALLQCSLIQESDDAWKSLPSKILRIQSNLIITCVL